ncbi:MAG TPA: hypothetical protein VLM38_23530 [Blastocatellia bacterium]|nr:hypothetical protein [Blastocatellia bacterium]
MEWSIHINGPDDARPEPLSPDLLASNAGPKLRPIVELTLQLIEEYFAGFRFERCVYGNEFCEHLIPSSRRLNEVINAALDQRMPLTLVTPYVSDAGIEALRPLFEMLAGDGNECEVVFNDWGVLNVLRREFPKLKPVQGRLLNKSLRDPRVTGVYATSEAPGPALVSLRRSNLDCASYTQFLSGFGVENVEMDNLPQGVDLGFVGNGVKASAYVPFGFISTSRICMASGIHYAKRDKFQPGAPCHHECQTHLLEYSYTNTPFANRDQKFYLKGNSYFYTHTETMLRGLFEQARAGLVDRIVFQPRLPMTWERC